jgi:hypothetical protein
MPELPKTTRDDWLKRAPNAAHALQGRIDGPRAFRPTHEPWHIIARMDHADLLRARQQAEDDLANGADGIVLTAAHLTPALETLPLHKVAIFNEAGDAGAEAIATLIENLPLDPQRLNIDFGSVEPSLIRRLVAQGFTGPIMRADGRVGHAHSLTDAQELGVTLALAKSRFAQLDFLTAEKQSSAVSMTLSASQKIFPTLAKFRASRIMWKQLLSDLKLPDAPLRLHAETSRMMMAEVDAHTNILRTATAAFAAGLGGADSICLLPFSFAQGTANAFSRRVARNSQLLLLHESHLWRVEDPGAGAGIIETLTRQFCEEAWDVFKKSERGDWPTGNRDNSPARPVIGVTKYQNYIETKSETEDPKAPIALRALPQQVGEGLADSSPPTCWGSTPRGEGDLRVPKPAFCFCPGLADRPCARDTRNRVTLRVGRDHRSRIHRAVDRQWAICRSCRRDAEW